MCPMCWGHLVFFPECPHFMHLSDNHPKCQLCPKAGRPPGCLWGRRCDLCLDCTDDQCDEEAARQPHTKHRDCGKKGKEKLSPSSVWPRETYQEPEMEFRGSCPQGRDGRVTTLPVSFMIDSLQISETSLHLLLASRVLCGVKWVPKWARLTPKAEVISRPFVRLSPQANSRWWGSRWTPRLQSVPFCSGDPQDVTR